jgi:hypothetical protein
MSPRLAARANASGTADLDQQVAVAVQLVQHHDLEEAVVVLERDNLADSHLQRREGKAAADGAARSAPITCWPGCSMGGGGGDPGEAGHAGDAVRAAACELFPGTGSPGKCRRRNPPRPARPSAGRGPGPARGGCGYVGIEHLLGALALDAGSWARRVVAGCGWSPGRACTSAPSASGCATRSSPRTRPVPQARTVPEHRAALAPSLGYGSRPGGRVAPNARSPGDRPARDPDPLSGHRLSPPSSATARASMSSTRSRSEPPQQPPVLDESQELPQPAPGAAARTG